MLPLSNLDSREKDRKNLKKAQWKLNMKLQREFKRKIRDIMTYLTERLVDLTKLQKQQKTRQSQETHQPTHNQFQNQQEDRLRFQQQIEVETATSHRELTIITKTDEVSRRAMEGETIRIRGDELKK